MKTEISISLSLVGKRKCYQCRKNLDCFSIIYNNKFIEYFICSDCYNLDKLHYIAWWMKVNLKRRKGFVNER